MNTHTSGAADRRAFYLEAMGDKKNHEALAFELAFLREKSDALAAGQAVAPAEPAVPAAINPSDVPALLDPTANADEYACCVGADMWNACRLSMLATRPAPPAMDGALKEMEARKDAAYLERNQVVAALASAYPSGIARTAIEGWSDDWHGCVYIDLPTGQASWHYHDSHAHLFAHLPAYQGKWDGHTTEEKYARLAGLHVIAMDGGEDAERLLSQILAASQDGDSDTRLSAHFVSRIETITKPGGAA